MNQQGCPICGFTDVVALDELNCTTFEICECCGTESGLDYDKYSTPEHLKKKRKEWVVENNCKWWGDKKSIPENWNPKKQMELASLEIPL